MKTYIADPKAIKETHQFHLVDATDIVLGRLASRVARLLCGKHKPIYTPFLDTGDHVIIVNADKIKLTGNKTDKKMMIHHTRYPGGLKSEKYSKILNEKPEDVIMKAVRGMLPKTRMGRKMLKKLRVHAGPGPNHGYKAQNPQPLEI